MKIFIFLSILTTSFLLCGCGTSVGNPLKSTVTIQSSAYTNPNNTVRESLKRKVSALSSKLSYELKLCVTDVIFINEIDERVEIELGDIGLIDLSDNTSTITWGSIKVDKDLKYDAIMINISQNQNLCNVDYSIRYEGSEIDADFTLFFEMPEVRTISENKYVRLELDTLVNAIDDGRDGDVFNNADWADYIDDFLGEFEEDDDPIDDEDVTDD